MPSADIGIILQGGLYNGVLRSLELLGYADAFGTSQVPLYILNVTYPLIPDEIARFCAGKRAVLVVEEGQPEFIEQALCRILHQRAAGTRIIGKEVLPMAGEYTGRCTQERHRRVSRPLGAASSQEPAAAAPAAARPEAALVPAGKLAALVPRALGALHRLSGAPALFRDQARAARAWRAAHQLRYRLPFLRHIAALQHGQQHHGLWSRRGGRFGVQRRSSSRRAVAIMGDGGFWHNGLTSGIGNAVFNRHDAVTVIVDNGYSAATGGQDILSSRAPPQATRRQSINIAMPSRASA